MTRNATHATTKRSSFDNYRSPIWSLVLSYLLLNDVLLVKLRHFNALFMMPTRTGLRQHNWQETVAKSEFTQTQRTETYWQSNLSWADAKLQKGTEQIFFAILASVACASICCLLNHLWTMDMDIQFNNKIFGRSY